MHEIKYSELVFRIRFIDDAVLPKNKTLMLNGALLNVLLNLYCINKRVCSNCNITSSCLIQNMLGNNYEANKPLILQSHNIQPYYMIDCDDENRNFNRDEKLTFSIRLINEAVDYISQFIYAFKQISNIGLSQNRAQYIFEGVYNNKKVPIFENGVFYESNIHIEYISDYITYRKSSIKDNIVLLFYTPFIIEQANFDSFFSAGKLFYCIKSRLKNLNVLEQYDTALLGVSEDRKCINNYNLNYTKRIYPIKELNQKKEIFGFKGKISFSEKAYDIVDYLIACEKLYIGSHILLGYGRYTIKGDR